ncbi:DUF6447 family protein [Yoonia sp.]|nr:DUF6447 family protein [Yoonia sp.]
MKLEETNNAAMVDQEDKDLGGALPDVRKTTVISIDGVEYSAENMSDAAKGAVASLQFVEAKLISLQNELAVHQTARFTYIKALQSSLVSAGQT